MVLLSGDMIRKEKIFDMYISQERRRQGPWISYIYSSKLQRSLCSAWQNEASIELLPITPNDVSLILLHKLTSGIIALDVRPRSGKVQDKCTMLPDALRLIEACDLLWKGVELPLGHDVDSVRTRLVVFHQLDCRILLAHVHILLFRIVMYSPGIV